MASNDSIKKTITVAVLLCIVCSVVVSTAAVLLRPLQDANKLKDFNRNILLAAGLYEDGMDIQQAFDKIETRIVDLETGKFTDAVGVKSFDQRKAAKDPSLSDVLSTEDDIANISRREKYSKVYLVRDNGQLQTVILPIKGYGLWGTLYGFLAVAADANTVVGLGYYEHQETPGLGAEVDNPRWKSSWIGKKLYATDGSVGIEVIKGAVVKGAPGAEYKVDGLSGATLTSVGVDNMMKFWLGENGYAQFLNNLKAGEA
ncbi:Na(+)-translocating NADH-quinone reductase subunit C [Teredinibacter waterburyi]|uniref:Na(+)-translocating NADH-quinone reductase subunit C n=1 Tax=Teredinibacter waterburyi TaxID=1500538 RepID=UPI00165EF09F|nr:Na(+)-translocating NADH-quinone reductase subunit C [Teredinibacter waterburyi]